MAGTNRAGHKGFQKLIPEWLIKKIRLLYQEGLSSGQVSEKCNVSKSQVALFVVDIARTPSEANQLRFPPRSKHWRSSRQAARRKVERKLGAKLSSELHVHHIDGDFTNNDIVNLAVLTAEEHSKLHISERLRNSRGHLL